MNSMKEKFPLTEAAAAALLFSFTLWVFGPANMFFRNIMEFNFSFSTVVIYLSGVAICCAILMCGLMYLFKNKGLEKAISLVFIAGVLLWVQGNLLVWSYGPLDGRDIDWNKHLKNGLFDCGIWILLIVFALVKSKSIIKVVRNVSMGFILIQLVSLSLAYYNTPAVPSFKKYTVDESSKFTFSSKKNVVILLLDTYQSDIFQEIISEDTKYKELFRGFTYFRNNLSVFPKTYLSVPSILTARAYDNSVTVQDFMKTAYTSDTSIPLVLKRLGFKSELYPHPQGKSVLYFDEAIASNIKKRVPGTFQSVDLAFLVDTSLFRQVPHFVKRLVYNDQAWLFSRVFSNTEPTEKSVNGPLKNKIHFSEKALQLHDIQFINQLVNRSSVDGETPVFKFFHLNGLHRPLVLNEKLEIEKMLYSKRSSFKSQGKACLEITRLLIESLKQIGAYDNTMLIVIGDHGCADYPYGVQIERAGIQADEPQGVKIPTHIKASGIPLVLIKPVGAGNDELKISDAPVSSKDISATVITAMGFPANTPGQSMFNIGEGEKRDRHFYYYNWNGWDNDYLYSIRDYLISGHAWLDSSWHEAGVIRAANAKTPYDYGTELKFDQDGNSGRFMGIGWHIPGKDGMTWTREKKAELYFYLKPTQSDLMLKMKFKPFIVPSKLDSQELHVYANGREISKLILSNPNPKEYTFFISKDIITNSEVLSIVFDVPTALSPVELGISTDVRNLGICVKSAVLEEIKKK